MSGTVASGHGSEEPQCYNCGAPGHWAVACPEPTRQTPAGLTAWRNSSTNRPGSGNGTSRDRRGPPKKHKGPIITKYGPPPGPHLQPHLLPHSQPHPAPVSSYAPSNAAYHPPAPYPSAGVPPPPGTPGYHHYAPLPPPGYSAGQHLPEYPPRHHIEPHYPPTPPGPPQTHPQPSLYNYDAQNLHGYPHEPPPPTASHYGPSPPGYHKYPDMGPDLHRYGPPPLPPPSFASPPPPVYVRPRSHSHSRPAEPLPRSHHRSNHHNERHRAARPKTPPTKRNAGSQPRGSSATSSTIQLPTPLIHSLPPKPPQSRHNQPEAPGGKKNKRNQDRKNRQRGNKQREDNRNKGRERKAGQSSPSHDTAERPSSKRNHESPEAQEDEVATEPPPSETKSQGTPGISSTKDTSPQDQGTEAEVHVEPPKQKVTATATQTAECSDQEEDSWEWNLVELFKESETQHAPDEVGKPLPPDYDEEVLLPRKWDAPCVVSEFVNPDNLEEYMRPVHETEYWSSIEFDPAFVVDGKFPCGEAIPKHLRNGAMPSKMEKGKDTSTVRTEREDSRKRPFHQGSLEDKSDNRATKRRRASDGRKTDSYVPARRRSTERSRSRERRSESRGSRPRSRRSSASSLNSLEAALLGISEEPRSSVEGRSPSPEPVSHRRDGSSSSPQMKRRRPRTDSAYSRRW